MWEWKLLPHKLQSSFMFRTLTNQSFKMDVYTFMLQEGIKHQNKKEHGGRNWFKDEQHQHS